MTVLYAVLQFFFWFAYGSAVNFSSVYLLACGLSSTVIGMISSAACALSVILQPLLASYADRERSLSIKTILLALSLTLAVSGGLMILSFGYGAALNGALLGWAILLVQVALPLVNALATESINAGKTLNFSLARGFGSIGYAVMSFSIGRLSASYGGGMVAWAIAVTSCCLLISIALFPFRKSPRTDAADKAVQDGAAAFLRRYPAFLAVLAGCSLIYTGHMLINTFVFQIVTYKGGTSAHMGVVMGMAGLLEVLAMFFFAQLLKWKDCGFWFRLSGIFFTLKSLGTLLAASMGALYAVQLIQPMGWGLMTVSSVYYVNSLMAEQDKIKGQAYMTMTLSVGTIFSSFIGGWLIDHAGVPVMLIVSVACAALGTVVLYFFSGKRVYGGGERAF